DDGYRTWTWTYAELAAAASTFGARLRAAGIHAGSAVAIWSENPPAGIPAPGGAPLAGVRGGPTHPPPAADFLLNVAGIVDAKAILVGETVDVAPLGESRPIWKLAEIFRQKADAAAQPNPEVGGDTTAEIIFTSGATAEPKGVVLTHKNILANIVPIE